MASDKVAVAVNSKENSRHAVKWALVHLVSSSDVLTLIHVRPTVQHIPTPMGSMPVSQLLPEIIAAYMRQIELQTDRQMKTFKKLCDICKVSTELLVVESDSPEKTIVQEILKHGITKLVLGASSRNLFTKKFIGRGLPACISQNAPDFCSVYVVSKKKLDSMKQCKQRLERDNSTTSSTSSSTHRSENRLQSQRSSISSLGEIEVIELDSGKFTSQTLPLSDGSRPGNYDIQKHAASLTSSMEPHVGGLNSPLLISNHQHNHSRDLTVPQQRHSESQSYCSSNDTLEGTQSYSGSALRLSGALRYVEHPFAPPYQDDWSNESYSSQLFVGNSNDQIEKLKWLLEQTTLLAERASETADVEAPHRTIVEQDHLLAAEKANESAAMEFKKASFHLKTLKTLQLAQARVAEEARKLQEALAEAQFAKQVAEEEARHRIEAEAKSIEDDEAGVAVAQALRKAQQWYRVYSFEEILAATNNLSEDHKLGEGGFGMVYKGKLHHTNVAIKVLKENTPQGVEEFEHEVEVLGRIHHPHMVLLLGCCPERACIIYEYMANGSLEDRLKCQGGTPPLPWYTRFKISEEVATALYFLHSSKPDPIVHRDIKPGNILLDQNFVTKLGDVGLASLVPAALAAKNSTFFRDTLPVGTFAYIDPEYQYTGFYGPKSDVYSFGVVLLQLLTGRPPLGLIKSVRDSLDSKTFPDILDQSAGKWPLQEATQVALLALDCANMRRKNRPDLETSILPILDKIREFSDGVAANTIKKELISKQSIPELFICPVLKEVMEDPVIAADGYTYEFSAIQQWLEEHDTSPLTHLPLPHKILTSNFSLRSGIRQWRKARF